LLGLLVIFAGIALSRVTAQDPPREIKSLNLSLTTSDSALTIDVGRLSQGSQIRIDFWVDRGSVVCRVMRSDMKTPLPESQTGLTAIDASDPFHTNQYHHLLLYQFDIPDTAAYSIIFSKPADADNRLISFLHIMVLSPRASPYAATGYALASAGFILVIVNEVRVRSLLT